MREGFESNYGHVTTYALVVVELILILKMIKLQCTHLLWLQLGLLFNMKENPDVSQVPDMIFSIHGHLLLLLYLFAASLVSTLTHTHTIFLLQACRQAIQLHYYWLDFAMYTHVTISDICGHGSNSNLGESLGGKRLSGLTSFVSV